MQIQTVATQLTNFQNRRMVGISQQRMSMLAKEMATGMRADVFRDLGSRSSITLNLRSEMKKFEEFEISNKQIERRMSIIADSHNRIRTEAQEFLNVAIVSQYGEVQTTGQLRQIATAAIANITQSLNVSYEGAYLFAGMDSQNKPIYDLSDTNGNGDTPMQVVQSVITGAPASAAAATAMISDIDAMFASTHATPGSRFEGGLYNGTAASAGGRVTAKIDDGTTVQYATQANDESFREMLKGLYMFSALDVTTITDPAAFEVYVQHASAAIERGIRLLGEQDTALGTHRQQVDEIISYHQNMQDVVNARILDEEYVDLYETQSKIAMHQVQLEATYSTTARISNLNLTRYLR